METRKIIEDKLKTTQTVPTPSESTKTFKKIFQYNSKTPLSVISPTKYKMSCKDWSEMSKRVDSPMSEEQDANISINI
jgi:hypothetical protein